MTTENPENTSKPTSPFPVAEYVPGARAQARAEAKARIDSMDLRGWIEASEDPAEAVIRASEALEEMRLHTIELAPTRTDALNELKKAGFSTGAIRFITGMSRQRVSEVSRSISGATKIKSMPAAKATAIRAALAADRRSKRAAKVAAQQTEQHQHLSASA